VLRAVLLEHELWRESVDKLVDALAECFASRRLDGVVAGFDEVIECRRMFGVPDYIARVAVSRVRTRHSKLETRNSASP